MSGEFDRVGQNPSAPFSLKVHRGDGMALLGMNWRSGRPPRDFVGFFLSYREPGSSRFVPIRNRLAFPDGRGTVPPRNPDLELAPSSEAPIQRFWWVHMPPTPQQSGEITYQAKAVYMNRWGELNYGEKQEVSIEIMGETHSGQLNVTFTRGFVASHAFAWRYAGAESSSPLLASEGLAEPSHPESAEAREWLGGRARAAILDALDAAIDDPTAEVRLIAHDLDAPEILSRLERLGRRLWAIVDDSGVHGRPGSPESTAAERLSKSAGGDHVRRQHLGHTQHNKTIVIQGRGRNLVICGSADFSWRGLYVRAGSVLVLRGEGPAQVFRSAFEDYWSLDDAGAFGDSPSARLNDLGLSGIDARVGFAPFAPRNAMVGRMADDLRSRTMSSLLYSLGALQNSRGPVRDAIEAVRGREDLFVSGIVEKKAGGLEIQPAVGDPLIATPSALSKAVPEPFRSEPTRTAPLRMHHKFLVLDFDRPTARVYVGSSNFDGNTDFQNGEHVLVIRDRRVAVSYAVEALRLIDHYRFLVASQEARASKQPLALRMPPRSDSESPWWEPYFSNPRKVRERLLFG